MGRLSVCHFQSSDTQRPNICLKIVASLLDYFWRHPERGTDECVALRFDVGELGSYAKVSQLDFSRLR